MSLNKDRIRHVKLDEGENVLIKRLLEEYNIDSNYEIDTILIERMISVINRAKQDFDKNQNLKNFARYQSACIIYVKLTAMLKANDYITINCTKDMLKAHNFGKFNEDGTVYVEEMNLFMMESSIKTSNPVVLYEENYYIVDGCDCQPSYSDRKTRLTKLDDFARFHFDYINKLKWSDEQQKEIQMGFGIISKFSQDDIDKVSDGLNALKNLVKDLESLDNNSKKSTLDEADEMEKFFKELFGI